MKHAIRITVVVGSIILFTGNPVNAAREFALECSEDYSECGGTDLPDACDEQVFLRSEIESSLAIWSKGWDLREANAWPQDWWEADTISGGLDTSYMDAIGKADFSFYAGHGTGAASEPNGSWDLHMGYEANGECQATAPGEMILGEQSPDGFGNNGDNEYVMMDASCSMVIGERQQVWENWGPGILMRSHQGMGYHGSPNDADDRGEEFIENIDDGDSNRSAWLDAGESCFLWWCWNSPAVITFIKALLSYT